MRHESAHNKTDEWLTPPEVLKALGQFDLDPCTPPDMPWRTAKVMLTAKEDGLKTPWQGRAFVNCPYGRETEKWVAKMAQHKNGIVLIFARTETGTFFNAVWGHASAMLFLKGRLKFYQLDHKTGQAAPGDASPAPSVLIAYDHPTEPTFNAQALRDSGLPGYYVDLTDADVVWRGWRNTVFNVLKGAESPLALKDIYTRVLAKIDRPTNKNQQAKIRQTLYLNEGKLFKKVDDTRWAVAA